MTSLIEIMDRLPVARRKWVEARTATILADEQAKRTSDDKLNEVHPIAMSSLTLAAYDLCEAVRDGLWDDALKHVPNRQPAACPEIIEALRRGCPGHTKQEYERAIAQAMFASH